MFYSALPELAMCIIAIHHQISRLMGIVPFKGIILGSYLLYYHLLRGSIRHTDNIHSPLLLFYLLPPQIKADTLCYP